MKTSCPILFSTRRNFVLSLCNIKNIHSSYSTLTKLGIRPALVDQLREKFHIEIPTPLQKNVIPLILRGHRDLLIKDITGSGKSFGLLLALMNKPRINSPPSSGSIPNPHLNKGNSAVPIHHLIVVPTRDIAYQFQAWARMLLPTSQFPDVASVLGVVVKDQAAEQQQEEQLSKFQPHIVVGTPNRLLSLHSMGKIHFQGLSTLVIDEADKVLEPLSKHATVKERKNHQRHPPPGNTLLQEIFEEHPKASRGRESPLQVICASATVNRALRQLLSRNKWVCDPIYFENEMSPSQLALPSSLIHYCAIVGKGVVKDLDDIILSTSEEDQTISQQNSTPILSEEDNYEEWEDQAIETIHAITNKPPFQQGLILTSSNASQTRLVHKLQLANLNALPIDIPKLHTSQSSLSKYLFVASKSNCRGIDIPSLSHVFIFGKPVNAAEYVHMAGRVGRMNRTGYVVTFIRENRFEVIKYKTVIKHLNATVTPLPK